MAFVKLTQTALEGRISAIEKDLATCQVSDRRHDGAIQMIFNNQNDAIVRLDRLETTPVTLTSDDLDTVTRNFFRRHAHGQSYDEGSDPEDDFTLTPGRTLADEIPAVSGTCGQHDEGTTYGQHGEPVRVHSYEEGSDSDPLGHSLVDQAAEEKIPAPLSDVFDSACPSHSL